MKSLLHGSRVWQVRGEDPGLIERAQDDLGCSATFARILTNRYGQSYPVVSGTPESGLHPPGELPDVDKAVQRIITALEEKEAVFIQGDFDVDGLSSAAIIYRGLKEISEFPGSGKLKVGVGDRERGHGLNKEISARLIDEGYDLLITTDCGVKGNEEINHLRNHGADVIVTDHHEPANGLPPAVAVVDAKRNSSKYPNPNLAGAGVAYKVIEKLYEEIGFSDAPSRSSLLQLAALGTISDLVPLVMDGEDENRRIAKLGIQEIEERPIPGISVLLKETSSSRQDEPVSPTQISYRLAPKLNSANRVGDPKVGFLLLSTDDFDRARHLSTTLIDYDRDRSRAQRRMIREAEEQLKLDGDPLEDGGVIFVAQEGWNPGVIGLVSSHLSNKYGRPAVAVNKEKRKCRGSARSVEGLSIVDGFRQCAEHLDRFGGHTMAGGFTTHTNDLQKLESCLNSWVLSELDDERNAEVRYVEGELKPGDVSMSFLEELELLRPFGEGNPEPRFVMKNLNPVSVRRVGKSKKHLKLKLAGRNEMFDCIGFGLGEGLSKLGLDGPVNPIFTLEVNVWNGERRIQLKLKDFVADR